MQNGPPGGIGGPPGVKFPGLVNPWAILNGALNDPAAAAAERIADAALRVARQGEKNGPAEALRTAFVELTGLVQGPKARQQLEALYAIEKAVRKGDRDQVLQLVGNQALKEVDRALDKFNACAVGGPLGVVLRGRSAVKFVQAVKNGVDAAKRGDKAGLERALAEAVQRFKELDEPCFVAGTLVITPDGAKAIELLQEGDWVGSSPEDDPNGPVEWRRVEAVFVNRAAVVYVRVQGQRIGTTAPHGFGVEERGWVPAGDLRAGDVLRSHDGQRPRVEAVSEPGEVVPVYNLKVEGYHTYFVGCPEWGFSVWVHNGDGDDCPPGKQASQDKDSNRKDGPWRAQPFGRYVNKIKGTFRVDYRQPGYSTKTYVSENARNAVVYLIVDRNTGQVLKVGSTDVGGLNGRADQYVGKARGSKTRDSVGGNLLQRRCRKGGC